MGLYKQPNEQALYVIKKSPYGEGKQLAMHITESFREGYLCFYDTNRGHMIEVKITEIKDTSFLFEDFRNRQWEFEEVTIENFRKNICHHVGNWEAIANLCTTTSELWEYFQELFPIESIL